MKKHNDNESGIALALVLIMVVILSVGMAAVSVLTKSTSGALSANAKNSEYRSKIINDALGKAIQELNYSGSLPFGSKKVPCSTNFPNGLGPYTADNDSESVTVYCSESSGSGESSAVASLILTGTGSDSCRANNTCAIGIDGGFSASVSGGSCEFTNPHMQLGAGIVNASGLWLGVGCDTLAIGAKAKIAQPLTSCPSAGFTERNSTLCSCPTSSKGSDPAIIIGSGNPASRYLLSKCSSDNESIDANELDIRNDASSLKSYIDTLMTSVKVPSSAVSVSQTSTSPCVYSMSPGIVTQSLWTSTKATIGNSTCTLRMTPGIYRFQDVAFDPANSTTVIAGNPSTSVSTCFDAGAYADSDFVQFQFSGTSSMTVANSGIIHICGDVNSPSVVAPVSGSFVSSPTGGKILQMLGGSASGTEKGLFVQGLVLAPGGAADLSLNGSYRAEFKTGAIFKAMSVVATNSPKVDSLVNPPPDFNGDRLVQFNLVGKNDRDLGTVQLVIRDYFGRRPSSGLSPLIWRTLW